MKFRFYNPGYFFRLAFQGIIRNSLMSLATVIVLVSALLLTGSTWALKKNADYNLQEINTYNKIVVFITKTAEDHTIRLFKEKVEAIPSVTEVEWVTKDEVLRDLFQSYGDYGDIFEMYGGEDNPCKDEIIITYSDSSKLADINYRIQAMNEEEETLGVVEKVNDRHEVAEKIDDIKNLASLIFTWLMVLLFTVSVFIIMNTIKLAVFSRREEVSIMRYVGASGFFVAFPFVLEGMLLGIVSSGAAFGLMYYIYRIFAVNILGGSGLVTILPFSGFSQEIILFFAAIGVGLGILGSLIALRKYNRN